MSAFGQAMLDTINGSPQQFTMSTDRGLPITMDCRDFLSLRPDEEELINECTLPDTGDVLDYGCGAGRHLAYIRERHPQVHCFGIDICDLMLTYCEESIAAPSTFVRSFNDLSGKKFDLIMLMGNGLGVLGSENDAKNALGILVQSLSPNGCIVIETGNPFGTDYTAKQFSINYRDMEDVPFTWGYSDRNWISHKLIEYGCNVDIRTSQAPGGMFFFVIGRKG